MRKSYSEETCKCCDYRWQNEISCYGDLVHEQHRAQSLGGCGPSDEEVNRAMWEAISPYCPQCGYSDRISTAVFRVLREQAEFSSSGSNCTELNEAVLAAVKKFKPTYQYDFTPVLEAKLKLPEKLTPKTIDHVIGQASASVIKELHQTWQSTH